MKQTLILTTALLSLTTLLSACGETSAVDGKTSAVASAVNDTHGHTPYEAFSAADNEKRLAKETILTTNTAKTKTMSSI